MAFCRCVLLSAAVVVGIAVSVADADPRKKPLTPARADRCTKHDPLPGTPAMPVGYFFGFSDPTDAGDPCTSEFTFESLVHAGKRDGRYVQSANGAEVAYTVATDVAVAVSVYGLSARWSDVTVLRETLADAGDGAAVNGLKRLAFDGISGELFVRVLSRSPGQPLAATVSVKPRWSRMDNITGYRAEGYGAELRLLLDAVLAERLFAAVNVNYVLGTQRFDIANAPWVNGSGTSVSAALTTLAYGAEEQFIETVFVGIEARYKSLFDGLALNRERGSAFFFGPTLAIGFPGERIISFAWSPQITGRARPASAPGALDLDNFERHEARMKLAVPIVASAQ
jgi:hypothetical protein